MNLAGRRSILLYLFATLGSLWVGCAPGRLYVSQPQVHSRERLVAERTEETSWLHAQLATSDTMKPTFQGVRDMRKFVGIYQELNVTVDPTQGQLNRAAANVQRTDLKADLWRSRRGELEARESYEAAQKAYDGGTTPEASAGSGGETPQIVQATPLAATAPFGRGYDELPSTPSPEPETTTAKGALLDLLHDKMAYRNAVQAAIRGKQLDDSHDQSGMMLYQLTLHAMVVPGRNEEQFCEVSLRLESPDAEADALERREKAERETEAEDGTDSAKDQPLSRMARLFDHWVSSLEATIVSEIAEVQTRFLSNQLTRADHELLHWFFGRHLHALERIDEDRREAIADYKKTYARQVKKELEEAKLKEKVGQVVDPNTAEFTQLKHTLRSSVDKLVSAELYAEAEAPTRVLKGLEDYRAKANAAFFEVKLDLGEKGMESLEKLLSQDAVDDEPVAPPVIPPPLEVWAHVPDAAPATPPYRKFLTRALDARPHTFFGENGQLLPGDKLSSDN